jgi:hypothetical protein
MVLQVDGKITRKNTMFIKIELPCIHGRQPWAILTVFSNKLTVGNFNNNHLITYILVYTRKDRGGHAQIFFESAIAIPQLEGSTSAIAIPQLFKEMLLRNRNSAIAIFSDVRNLRASFPQFSAYFWPWNPVGVHGKKSEVKNLVQLSL